MSLFQGVLPVSKGELTELFILVGDSSNETECTKIFLPQGFLRELLLWIFTTLQGMLSESPAYRTMIR